MTLSPFPTLSTHRLTLRQLNDTDDLTISSLRSNERVNQYIDRPKQTSIDEAKAFITKINDGIKLNQWIYWTICLKDNSELIGTICLWNFSEDKMTAELGYELSPTFQGQGLMNEAFKIILNYGFQTMGLKNIEAFVHKDNDSSIRLLVKNNFKLEAERKDEKNSNNLIFSLAEHIFT